MTHSKTLKSQNPYLNEERRDERPKQKEKDERKSVENQYERIKRINALLSAVEGRVVRSYVVTDVVRVVEHRIPILGGMERRLKVIPHCY